MHSASAQHLEQYCLAGGSSGKSVLPCHMYKVHLVMAATPAEEAAPLCSMCAASLGMAASLQVC